MQSKLTSKVLAMDAHDVYVRRRHVALARPLTTSRTPPRPQHSLVKFVLFVPMALYFVSFLFDVRAARARRESTDAAPPASQTHRLTFERVLRRGPDDLPQEIDLLWARAKDTLMVSVTNYYDPNDKLVEWPEGKGWTIIDFHAYPAMLLLACALFQKESARWMAQRYAKWVGVHRWTGRLGLAMLPAMMWYANQMKPLISVVHFQQVMHYFMLPFCAFALGLYLTASPPYIAYHRLFGNMMLKACVGTPLARIVAAIIQERSVVRDRDWEYYRGIGFVSGALALWQLLELVRFFVWCVCLAGWESRDAAGLLLLTLGVCACSSWQGKAGAQRGREAGVSH
jgi:hypothetical protein